VIIYSYFIAPRNLLLSNQIQWVFSYLKTINSAAYSVCKGNTMNAKTLRIPRKPAGSYAVKRCISMPGQLGSHAEARCRELGYFSFSDYIQHLIRQDGFSPGSVK